MLGSLAPAGSALAAARPARPMSETLTGSLSISWAGDPARGCAAAGQCGVNGVLQMLPNGGTGSSSGVPPLELTDSNAVVRETLSGPGGPLRSTCADLLPVDLAFGVRHVPGGLRAVTTGTFQPPSSGRCAGPTTQDLTPLTLPARRFGAHSYDLSGTTRFGAGPFAVTAVSTVRALVTAGASNGFPFSPVFSSSGGVSSGRGAPPRSRRALQEHAEYDYRIQGMSGTLSTAFAASSTPLCLPLGACGTTGELTGSFTPRGTIRFTGSRTVKRRVGPAGALADLRAGRMELGDNFYSTSIRETLTETLTRPSAQPCTDSSQVTFQGVSRPGGRGIDALLLAPSQGFFGSVDPLRTRCAGPSGRDVLGNTNNASLARGTVTAAELGARRLEIVLGGAGAFSTASYAGQRSGSVLLSLILERETGGTRRVRLFGGPPVAIPR